MLSDESTQYLAYGVLALLGVAAIAALVLAFRHSPYDRGQTVLYFINRLFTRILWRAEISGPLPLAPQQGAVIVCNHISGVDPLVIQIATNRVVHWLVAREYMTHWSMAWAFKILRSIPVNRGGIDTAATKLAIRLVSQGELVGMFPEGRINTSGELLMPGRPGAILVALKGRVPILPCYIADAPYDGSSLGSFMMTARTKLKIGPLMDISAYYGREREDGVLEALTRRALKEVARLAGRPDYEPRLAGRRWKPGEEDAVAEVQVA